MVYYLIIFKSYGITKKAIKTFDELKKDCERCNGAYMGDYRSAHEMIKHLFENIQGIKKTRSWKVAQRFIFGQI